MEADPTRMCEKLVGLGDVDLVGINDSGEGAPLEVVIRSRKPRPSCEACGGPVWSKGERSGVGGFTGVRPSGSAAVAETPLDMSESRLCAQIVHRARPHDWSPTALLTSRAARWVTIQVGRRAVRSTRSPQSLVVGGIR